MKGCRRCGLFWMQAGHRGICSSCSRMISNRSKIDLQRTLQEYLPRPEACWTMDAVA